MKETINKKSDAVWFHDAPGYGFSCNRDPDLRKMLREYIMESFR